MAENYVRRTTPPFTRPPQRPREELSETRRYLLAEDASRNYQIMDRTDALQELGVFNLWSQFQHDHQHLLLQVVQLTLQPGFFPYGWGDVHSARTQREFSERQIAACFHQLLKLLTGVDVELFVGEDDELNEAERAQLVRLQAQLAAIAATVNGVLPRGRYMVEDHQDQPVPGSNIKPDFLVLDSPPAGHENDIAFRTWNRAYFAVEVKGQMMDIQDQQFPTTENDDFGQLCDYGYMPLNCQPLRRFSVDILVHGNLIDLMVFLPGRVIRTHVGAWSHSNQQAHISTLATIMFLFTPAFRDRMFIAPITNRHTGIRFTVNTARVRDAPRQLHITLLTNQDVLQPGDIRLADRLGNRTVLTGVSNAQWLTVIERDGMQAGFLASFSWRPVHAICEGAVVNLLAHHRRAYPLTDPERNPPGLAHVHVSGVLAAIDGWQLEVTIYEDIGVPATQWFYHLRRIDFTWATRAILQQLTGLVVFAWEQGVMHRAISPRNIFVRHGRNGELDIYLVGWYLSRVSLAGVFGGTDIAQWWDIDEEQSLRPTEHLPPVRPELEFRSPSVLFGNRRRTVVDDLGELLLSASSIVVSMRDDRPIFEQMSTKSAAAVRARHLKTDADFVAAMKLDHLEQDTQDLLCEFRRALFDGYDGRSFADAAISFPYRLPGSGELPPNVELLSSVVDAQTARRLRTMFPARL